MDKPDKGIGDGVGSDASVDNSAKSAEVQYHSDIPSTESSESQEDSDDAYKDNEEESSEDDYESEDSEEDLPRKRGRRPSEFGSNQGPQRPVYNMGPGIPPFNYPGIRPHPYVSRPGTIPVHGDSRTASPGIRPAMVMLPPRDGAASRPRSEYYVINNPYKGEQLSGQPGVYPPSPHQPGQVRPHYRPTFIYNPTVSPQATQHHFVRINNILVKVPIRNNNTIPLSMHPDLFRRPGDEKDLLPSIAERRSRRNLKPTTFREGLSSSDEADKFKEHSEAKRVLDKPGASKSTGPRRDESEEDVELEESYVEKIVAAKKMKVREAKDYNARSSFHGAVHEDTSVDHLRLLKDNTTCDDKEEKTLYLIKPRSKSYLHLEYVTEDLILAERAGKNRFNRFHNSQPRFIKERESESEVVDVGLTTIDRILYHHIESKQVDGKQVSQTSYFVKWQKLSLEECSWELEQDLKRVVNAEGAVDAYYRGNQPPARKLQGGGSVARPEFKSLEASPAYRNGNQLRPYQLEGLNWLMFCWVNRQSCIIADEMGLGKTVQSVSLIWNVVQNYDSPGPFIVVAPLSTLEHWRRELDTWTSLRVLVYHGKVGERDVMFDYEFFYRDRNGFVVPGMYKFDVLLTTYEMCLNGASHLQEIFWKIGVFDEAHRLKNRNSKATELLRTFKFEFKVLLTGTPLQNSLEELWSLLNFMQPYRFADFEEFMSQYGNLEDSEDVTKLQELLKPIMLRRLKEDVEKSIPLKEETIVEVELTPVQKRYYRAILERNFNYLIKGCKGTNVPNLLNVMMELRKCCIHPYLIKGAEQQILEENRLSMDSANGQQMELLIRSSGKLVLVDKLLKKLRAGGHKVLIFSQMTKCLDLLSEFLHFREYTFERLDGSIRGDLRQASIDRFCDKDSDCFVFLLCTRAGGVGINLTAADTVVIFDSDWNPQNDIQAQARCHRIGQSKSVKVYRLVTRGTYEREMLEKAGLKLGLDKAILQRMVVSKKVDSTVKDEPKLSIGLTKKEVELLLKKGAYATVMDNDEDSVKFCEEDIDHILARRATVVRHEGENEVQESQTSIFSKASFIVTDGGEFDVELDDPEFWTLWAKRNEELAKKQEEEQAETVKTKKMVEKETVRRKGVKRSGYYDDDADDGRDPEDDERFEVEEDTEEYVKKKPAKKTGVAKKRAKTKEPANSRPSRRKKKGT